VKTSRRFAPEAGSIPAARRFVLAAAGDVDKYRHDAIAVMASELAMNAVQYARTEFTVTIEITGGTLRVEVADSAPGNTRARAAPTRPQPARTRPVHRRPARRHLGNHPITAGPGKTVWFQTALRTGVAAAGRAAAPVLAGGDAGWQQGQLGRAEAGADRAHDGEDREAMREMLAQARSARQAARLDRYAADQDRVAADRDRGSAQADRRAAGDDRQVARADRDQAMIESEEEDSPLMD